MKRILLAGVAVLALTAAQPTLAADAPVYKGPAPAPAALFNWSGFYVGLQAGYGWGDITHTYTPVPQSTSFRISGFVGGGTAGYNWQAGSLVFGVEGDVSYADVKGSILTTTFPCVTPGEACAARLSWFGTGRLRLGVAVGDFMPYVTGGVAVGGISASADLAACAAATCGYSETRRGWTAGGGAEWRFVGNWSAKIEYLYVNLGTPSFNAPTVTASNFAFSTVRGGLNLHF